MAKRIEIPAAGEEVLAGDSKNHNGNNSRAIDEPSWNDSTPTQFDNILDIPPIADMARVLAMSNLADDESRIAYLRIIRRLEKGLSMATTKEEKELMTSRLEFIRQCLASTLGYKAFGKTLQLQNKIELIAPAVIRDQLGMKAAKHGEDTVRGSDFRQPSQTKDLKDAR